MKRIDVCLSPSMFQDYVKDNSVVVMVDAIRASASICTAFMNGVEFIIPVSDKIVAKSYKKKGFVIAGERNGETIEGFDFGNSPFNFSKENIKGKKLAFTTTNGTKVINLVKNSKYKNIDLYIGSFANITALSSFLSAQNKDVLILCSGWKNSVNIEDTLFAGKLTSLLLKSNRFELFESANLAFNFFLNSGNSYYDFVMENSPRLKKKSIELEKDFRYCLTENITNVIPYLSGDKLLLFEHL